MDVGKFQEFLAQVIKIAYPTANIDVIDGEIIMHTDDGFTIELYLEAFPTEFEDDFEEEDPLSP